MTMTDQHNDAARLARLADIRATFGRTKVQAAAEPAPTEAAPELDPRAARLAEIRGAFARKQN